MKLSLPLVAQCQTFNEVESRQDLTLVNALDGLLDRGQSFVVHVHLRLTEGNQRLNFHHLVLDRKQVVSVSPTKNFSLLLPALAMLTDLFEIVLVQNCLRILEVLHGAVSKPLFFEALDAFGFAS